MRCGCSTLAAVQAGLSVDAERAVALVLNDAAGQVHRDRVAWSRAGPPFVESILGDEQMVLVRDRRAYTARPRIAWGTRSEGGAAALCRPRGPLRFLREENLRATSVYRGGGRVPLKAGRRGSGREMLPGGVTRPHQTGEFQAAVRGREATPGCPRVRLGDALRRDTGASPDVYGRVPAPPACRARPWRK